MVGVNMFPYSDIELNVDGKKIETKDMYLECVDYKASISDPYKVAVTLKRGNFEKEFIRDDFVTKTVSLSFKFDKKQIKYSGVISDFNSSVKFIDSVLYEYFSINFGPEFFGKNTKHNKVYLNKSTVDIAKYLIDNNTNIKLSSKAKGGSTPRDFSLQYQSESDRTFLIGFFQKKVFIIILIRNREALFFMTALIILIVKLKLK